MIKLSFETKVTPSIDINTEEMRLMISNAAGQHFTEVLRTKDEATRAALIALGWTPPTDKNTSSKNGRTLILVTEIYLDYFGSYTGRQTFRVDYDKFLVWKREHAFEAGYIEHILEDAFCGKLFCSTSRKYSFSDCSSWYLDIQTLEPENCFETVLTIDVDVK